MFSLEMLEHLLILSLVLVPEQHKINMMKNNLLNLLISIITIEMVFAIQKVLI